MCLDSQVVATMVDTNKCGINAIRHFLAIWFRGNSGGEEAMSANDVGRNQEDVWAEIRRTIK